jgi:hypothetical protein
MAVEYASSLKDSKNVEDSGSKSADDQDLTENILPAEANSRNEPYEEVKGELQGSSNISLLRTDRRSKSLNSTFAASEDVPNRENVVHWRIIDELGSMNNQLQEIHVNSISRVKKWPEWKEFMKSK